MKGYSTSPAGASQPDSFWLVGCFIRLLIFYACRLFLAKLALDIY